MYTYAFSDKVETIRLNNHKAQRYFTNHVLMHNPLVIAIDIVKEFF